MQVYRVIEFRQGPELLRVRVRQAQGGADLDLYDADSRVDPGSGRLPRFLELDSGVAGVQAYAEVFPQGFRGVCQVEACELAQAAGGVIGMEALRKEVQHLIPGLQQAKGLGLQPKPNDTAGAGAQFHQMGGVCQQISGDGLQVTDSLDVPVNSVRVWLNEFPPDQFMVAGELWSERGKKETS